MIEFRFDHVGLNVADLDTSIKFLEAMFGFEVIQKWDSPRQAFVGKGAVVLGVMEKTGYDFSQNTMAHIAFPCRKEDFRAIVGRVQKMGATIVADPKPQRDGETILFCDPSGNIFEVCYPSLMQQRENSAE